MGFHPARVHDLNEPALGKLFQADWKREPAHLKRESANLSPHKGLRGSPPAQVSLELPQKQEQQARAEEAEAEQRLRDEQIKLDGLNDLLDRYNNALANLGRQ